MISVSDEKVSEAVDTDRNVGAATSVNAVQRQIMELASSNAEMLVVEKSDCRLELLKLVIGDRDVAAVPNN